MKIETKLTSDQIFAVAKLLEQVYDTYPEIKKQDKLVRSIAFDIADKFTTKQRTIYKSNTLFDQKKKYRVTLKFHEAVTLNVIIAYFLPSIPATEKAHNDLLMLRNKLDQQTI